MDRDSEELGNFDSEETTLADRDYLGRMLGMKIPAIGLESEAGFEKLIRALDSQRDRQRRWLTIACSFGAAAIVALITMLRLMHRGNGN